MDPHIALERLLDAIRERNIGRIRQHAYDLRNLIANGDSPPEMRPHDLFEIFAAMHELSHLIETEDLDWLQPFESADYDIERGIPGRVEQ